MTLLQSLYCNQYYDLKKQGKEYAAHKNGNITVTVSLLFNVCTVFFLLAFLSDSFADFIGHGFKHFFQGITGKGMGRLIALLLMATIYPIVIYTVGKKENFDKTIAAFEAMSDAEQKEVSSKGIKYFFGSIGIAFVSVLLFAL